MLKDSEYEQIREELDYCSRPLYFFHDDADGVSSFLQMYRYKREGQGVIIKANPNIDMKFISKVESFEPDKIFVLDIAQIEQEFIDSVNVPVVWVDHHGPYNRTGVKYFNPRVHSKISNPPVSYLISKALNQPDDWWIAMTGCIGDWYLPPNYKKFSKKFPKLLPAKINRPQDALFTTTIGVLAEVFTFVLKGTATDALKHVKVLTRIKEPAEILNQTTAQGKFIWKRYEYVRSLYLELLEEAKKAARKKSRILYFHYTENKMSFTGELSNELLFRYPKKIILIAREKDGEMKCSLRSSDIVIPPILHKCLVGLVGRGGGHEHACGAVIAKSDFEEFMKRFEKELK